MKKEEFVKLGISEELAVECEKASLEELKSFIPKSRFDEVNKAKNDAEALVKERDGQIETLKNSTGDVNELKKQIEDLQKANKDAADKHAEEINKMKIDSALDVAISNAKGKNAKAIKALLNLENAELDEDGTIKGLADQMTALQKSDEYLFEAKDNKTKMKGVVLGQGADTKLDGLTKEQFAKMSYKEKVNLFNENKELYDSLSK
jgi:hypothetical protein